MKIAINNCHGGFDLSLKAYKEIAEIQNWEVEGNEAVEMFWWIDKTNGESIGLSEIPRNDETLIKIIEKLGKEANCALSDLKIVEIPDDVEWQIEDYDGREWIAEKHRTWC